uniref:Uncharacterized protein n=1 Tax=Solanum tuberosum TaxID=4113 RepID=M1E099_SOLTU
MARTKGKRVVTSDTELEREFSHPSPLKNNQGILITEPSNSPRQQHTTPHSYTHMSEQPKKVVARKRTDIRSKLIQLAQAQSPASCVLPIITSKGFNVSRLTQCKATLVSHAERLGNPTTRIEGLCGPIEVHKYFDGLGEVPLPHGPESLPTSVRSGEVEQPRVCGENVPDVIDDEAGSNFVENMDEEEFLQEDK